MNDHTYQLLYKWYWEELYNRSPHVQRGRYLTALWLEEYRGEKETQNENH